MKFGLLREENERKVGGKIMNQESEKSCLDCKWIKIIPTFNSSYSSHEAICFHDNIERANITDNYALARYCARYEPAENRRKL